MDSYRNFKNFGNDLLREGGAAPVNDSFSQQGSINSSWTVDQYENSLGDDYGSINNELLNDISQGVGLKRKYITEGEHNGGTNIPQVQGQQTLGDITLDEFLIRVGVKGYNNSEGGFRDQSSSISSSPNVSSGFGFKQKPIQYLQGSNLHSNVLKYQPEHTIMSKPNGYGNGTQIGFPSGQLVNTHGNRGGFMETGDQILQNNSFSLVPRVTRFHRLRTNNGDSSLVSPAPYTLSGRNRVLWGRESNNDVAIHKKAGDKKQRRKIKNREAAARSRARQQAQVMELEAEVEKLKKENHELLRKQEEMSKMQTKSAKGMINLKERPERRLRRTQSDIK